MEETPQPSQQPQQVPSPMITETRTQNSFSSKGLYIVIGVVFILLVGGGAYALLRHNKTQSQTVAQQTTQSASPTSTTASQPTPVISPVTSGNVDQTLNNTDTTMQNSINQANTDLNSVDNIDKSQDNTSGL